MKFRALEIGSGDAFLIEQKKKKDKNYGLGF